VRQFLTELNGIQKAYETDFNGFTVQILNIIEAMVRLGFYADEGELKLMVDPLITLLDGSLDFFSRDEELILKQK